MINSRVDQDLMRELASRATPYFDPEREEAIAWLANPASRFGWTEWPEPRGTVIHIIECRGSS